MKTHHYQKPGNDYDSLSFRDLLDARDAYHIHLMNHPHVIATAVGRYRIRVEDSWPDADGTVKRRGAGPRTLGNSEVRPYSWPAILVFVDEWVEIDSFSQGAKYDPDEMIPRTLYLPDGRRVPVCVIQVDKVIESAPVPPKAAFPLNNIGGGNPVLVDVQGREHVATVACLVSDGHRTYGLTNRHVAGNEGEVLYSRLNGRKLPIGIASGKQLTRLPFSDVYRDWAGKSMYLNLDAGLIDIDDLNAWTAQVHGIGTIGPMMDMSSINLSLSLVGTRVVGMGGVSGRMEGEISALLYRYKSVGGFEYLADFLIGPRGSWQVSESGKRTGSRPELLTRPGDSGTLWLLDPLPNPGQQVVSTDYRPFAIQWGAQVFEDSGVTSYALASSLSTVCQLLDLDLIRDWNLDQVDTWGSVGHFSIAYSAAACLSNSHLKTLMTKNADLISPGKDDLLSSPFKGMGSDDFVPLADVPDMFWKFRVAKQGYARRMEGPNHFADMDQVRPSDGETLLHLTLDDAFIDPTKWNAFYSSVSDILSGKPIAPEHRGLLPFRVWQIYDEMVRFASGGKMAEFVCAAGVLTHYVGDACQPLHISYLHDGDPGHPVTTSHTHHGTPTTEQDAKGAGVHSAYEDAMVNSHRSDILDALGATPKVRAAELIETGFDAAKRTIKMMRTVFERLPPRDLVDYYINNPAQPKQMSAALWQQFGDATMECMQDGVHLIAVLWQSAWVAGKGDSNIATTDLKPLTKARVMKLCQNPDFLPSMSIDQIHTVLKKQE